MVINIQSIHDARSEKYQVLFLVDLFHFDVYICINYVYLLFILITLIFVLFVCTLSSDFEFCSCSCIVEMVNLFTTICLLVWLVMQWKVWIFVMVMVMHCRTATCTFNYGTQKAVTSDLHIVVPGMGVGSYIQPNVCVNIPCNSLPVMNCSMDITGFLKHFWICHNGAVSKFLVIWKSDSA